MSLKLSEVMENVVAAMLEQVHTAIPGRVVSYDGHDKRTATVQPSVRMPTSTGPLLDIPPIQGVPVMFPSTDAGSLLFPLKKGDGVLIIIAEVGIGRFMDSETGDVADPDDGSRHTLTDAICIPGLWSLPSVPGIPTIAADAVALVTKLGTVVELGKTLGLRNENSDLRKEMEKLWDELAKVRSDMATHFTNLQASCATIPTDFGVDLGLSFGVESAAETAASTALDAPKKAVGKLLT